MRLCVSNGLLVLIIRNYLDRMWRLLYIIKKCIVVYMYILTLLIEINWKKGFFYKF